MNKTPTVLTALAAGVVVLAALGLALGPVRVPLHDTVRVLVGAQPSDPRWQVIVHSMRLPRVLTAIAVGAGLGVAGLQMQTLFRNPLADPYVLGVSSGASLGVAVVVIGTGAGFSSALPGGVVLAAALGAAAVLAIVLVLARWVRSAVTLLLIGVMVGAASTAIVSVLLVYADPQRVSQYLLWGLGSFAGTGWADLRLLLPVVAAGVIVSALTVRPLNALLLGENYARTMGVHVRRVRLITVASASLLAGATTAFCGPIAFLGLAVPHLTRLALGTSDHRWVLPGVVLMGAAAALGCGVLSQLPGSGAVLPVNAVTALLGAPIVVIVLLRSRRGVGLAQ
ncbi:FecCD family ABC transporter permease [Mycobacterium shimoidei]|uniref:Transport system permease [Thermomonospora curvata DSM] n=1 Tax=Mycobacterium shimoidei TaxID=29313 RepID=A0A1E3TJD1_MYCSH|nr:iron ABC transporter permease [Mycobacterium shimoidei]MCV7257982.1 iron ABC transporter permease [Mycobacterium shimoidei]ODR14083.1 iron ABC transporter [Mycobacterium shimoidei]ORW78862.1 iron ABC transporter [Mycobacterium shimoidei]SRX96407.1 transport system permease [Thermomonospora curvata DSM] [Mycobacterium shimoidei]